MTEQALAAADSRLYELDHRIPLALGGHPRSLVNLTLQKWEGEEGARKKDRLERRMQLLVCQGRLSLNDARREIYFDWGAAYRAHIDR